MSDLTAKGAWRRTVGLVGRTTPFLILRMGVYLAFFVLFVVWIGLWGGLAALFGDRAPALSVVFVIIGLAGPGALFALARRYVLYMVTGAHIAVATKLLLGGSLPGGKGQVAYGREVVQTRFTDMSVLFGLDRLIDGAVRGVTNRVVRLLNRLPLGREGSALARMLMQIVRRSLSYVDEAILSYAVAKDSETVWRSARHGVILYGQAYKPILKSAVVIWLVGQVLFLALLVVLAVPAYVLLGLSDSGVFMVAVVAGTLLLAKLIELAIFEPFATIYTMATYHGAVQGLTPDPTWDARLQQVSKHFRELVGKAQQDGADDPLDGATPQPQAVAASDHQPPASPPARVAPPSRSPQPRGQAPGLGGLGGLVGGRRRNGLGGVVGGLIGQAVEQAGAAARTAGTGGGTAPASTAPGSVPEGTAPQPVGASAAEAVPATPDGAAPVPAPPAAGTDVEGEADER
jgi:hypothetical protein